MALSESFRWVEVNRDHSPLIPKQFSVSAYPSLIVVGARNEKIYRFKGFMPPAELIRNLEEGLRRFELYKSGKPWDERPARPDTICDRATVETIKAPSEDQPGGAVVIGEQLFVAQDSKLYQVNLQTGKTEKTIQLPRQVRGLASHEGLIYAIDYGWTAGKPIYVIDPVKGEVVREIVTEANKKNRYMAASGICFVGERLMVLSRRSDLHELDPATGEILKSSTLPERSWKLTFDGEHLVTASHVSNKAQQLLFIDPLTMKLVAKVPLNYGLSALDYHAGTFLMMEQPVRGFDAKHKRVRIYPDQMLIHQVRLISPKKPGAKPEKSKD